MEDFWKPLVEPKVYLVNKRLLSIVKTIFLKWKPFSGFIYSYLHLGWLSVGSKSTSTVYPIAPGIIAGKYDPKDYEFKNLTFEDNLNDFIKFEKVLKNIEMVKNIKLS